MFAIDNIKMNSDFTLNTLSVFGLNEVIKSSFSMVAPVWPLKNVIAVNPLRGLEGLTFEEAIRESVLLFEREGMPDKMHDVNRLTIKWCQAYFDEGQATIAMPLRSQGLYLAFKQLAVYDDELIRHSPEKIDLIKKLPDHPDLAIASLLRHSGLPVDQYQRFLTLLLTTLAGWSGYISYLSSWSGDDNKNDQSIQTDYMAIRVMIAFLMGVDAKKLCDWYSSSASPLDSAHVEKMLTDIANNENRLHQIYVDKLTLAASHSSVQSTPDAQFVFCIDVRSEPMRFAIEQQGAYETYGFAGFFGVPVSVSSELDQVSHASCPVLLSPSHHVVELINDKGVAKQSCQTIKARKTLFSALYESMKYKFSSPFVLVDLLGLFSGLWMLIRTLCPQAAKAIMNRLFKIKLTAVPFVPMLNSNDSTDGIPFAEQCRYADAFLRTIGLTRQFSKYVILCGHGAETENNAYQSALDCGACGGYQGAPNARIMSSILNDRCVREELARANIIIPDSTRFIPALHNTTTDDIYFLMDEVFEESDSFHQIKTDIANAKHDNNVLRLAKLPPHLIMADVENRAANWAEVRPEWGLAKNTAFIIGPRQLTKSLKLEGRAFLHSYDWREDNDGSLLASIMNGPVIVAQWINCQYLFSSINNVAYGSGSKITQNVTGKIGVMQGNASDLMHGLPLQSVNFDDVNRYHEPTRLMVIINAPRSVIDNILNQCAGLRHLFENGWMMLVCIEAESSTPYRLTRELTWNTYSSLH